MNTKTNVQKAPKPAYSNAAEKQSVKKWGQPVLDLGFSIIPSLIFRAQARLGLNPSQLVLLLHLVDYWWDNENIPFPSKAALSERVCIGPRQIQRYLTDLEKGGLLKRVERFHGHNGQKSNGYDLSGLVKKLKEYEPEFRQVKEQAKEQSRNVSKRGGLVVNHKAKAREGEDE